MAVRATVERIRLPLAGTTSLSPPGEGDAFPRIESNPFRSKVMDTPVQLGFRFHARKQGPQGRLTDDEVDGVRV